MPSSPVTFVSAYYTLHSTPYFNSRPEEWSPAPIFELARTGIQLCLYVGPDCAFETAFTELEKECPNFRVMPYRLYYKDMWVHRTLEELNKDRAESDQIGLPASRNLEKDTLEYLVYMNSRYEIIEDAISENPWDSSHFAWIDFNAPRLFSKKSESFETLKEIAAYSFASTGTSYFAGCWPKLAEDSARGIADTIHWRFCGAFFLGDIKSFADFADQYRSQFPAFLKEYGVFPWEVNFWAWLEYKAHWNPTWYRGDHNDNMLNIFSGISADTYATPLFLNGAPTLDPTTHIYPKIEPFLPGSASYLAHEGRHYLNTRFVNYWMYPSGYYKFYNADLVIENRNFLSRLDADTLEPIDFREMDEKTLYGSPDGQPLVVPKREKRSFSVGLEDIRLFSGIRREDGTRPVRFIATNVEYSPTNKNRMVLGTYDMATMEYRDCVLVSPPDPNSWCEKNWIPVLFRDGRTEGEEEERFIYKWSPMEIGRIDPETNQLNIVLRHDVRAWLFSRLRGSTTFVDAPLGCLPNELRADLGKEYLVGLAHFSEEHSPRHYYHVLILLEKRTLKPVRYSRVFYFEKLSIEFCIGMTVRPAQPAEPEMVSPSLPAEPESREAAKGTYLFWISRFDRDPIRYEIAYEELPLENMV